MIEQAQDLSFEDIQVGRAASFTRTIEERDVLAFANLSGDHNPLHVDKAYAAETKFKQPLVHGMLLGSLCSTLVGMYLPGKRCLYLSQTLIFKNPAFVGEEVEVAGEVVAKSEATRMLTISISINTKEKTLVEGEAKVQVLD